MNLEVFRFWFCFHWIMFFILWEIRFILLLFGFLSINNYVYLSFDFEWSCLMSFLIFELILLMFWLQNRYKSCILKPKSRFYLCFGYKVVTHQVFVNRRTGWDPNPKLHRIVPVLWRFTNSNPNPIEPKPVPNRTFI